MSDLASFLHALKRANEFTINTGALSADAMIAAGRANKRLDHMIAGLQVKTALDEIDQIIPHGDDLRGPFARLNEDFREAFS